MPYKGKVLRAQTVENGQHLPASIANMVTYVGRPRRYRLAAASRITFRLGNAPRPLKPNTGDEADPDAPPPPQEGINSPVWPGGYFGRSQQRHCRLQPSPLFKETLPWLVCGYTPQQIRQAYGSDEVKQERIRGYGRNRRRLCIAPRLWMM